LYSEIGVCWLKFKNGRFKFTKKSRRKMLVALRRSGLKVADVNWLGVKGNELGASGGEDKVGKEKPTNQNMFKK